MKRLLLLAPLLLVLAGCGTTKTPTAKSRSLPKGPAFSRTATLDDVSLRLDVAGLHRRGRVVALDLRLVNRDLPGSDAFSVDDTFSREGDDDLGDVMLVDPQTGRELKPLQQNGLDLYSLEISGGGSQMLSVRFPAPSGPAADVLVPHFGLFRDVQVQ